MVAGTATEAEPVIAASYERVSTRAQGQTGFSLIAQRQSGEDFALARGWQLPPHLQFRDGEETNASGADWDLPALNAMLDAARQRQFRYLIVPDRDRLARGMLKGKLLEAQLQTYGVHVVYQRAPTDEGAEGELVNNVLHSLSEFERAKTRWRTMNGRLTKARTGRVVGNGGRAPYGHRLTTEVLPNGRARVAGMEPDPVTAPIAIRIVRMARHMSAEKIAATLDAEGEPPPIGSRGRGRKWFPKTVRRIASETAHIGHWRYVDIDVPVPPLLDDPGWQEEWEAAQRAFATRRGRAGARVTPDDDRHLLRTALTCGHCGAILRSTTNGRSPGGLPARYYVCACHAPSRAKALGLPACVLPDVPAAAIEEEAWRVVSETLLDPEMLAAGIAAAAAARGGQERVRRDQRAIIDAEIATHRRALDGLVDKLATIEGPELTDAVMRRAKELETTIAVLNRRRAQLAGDAGEGLTEAEGDALLQFAETAREGTAHATPPERRALFRTLSLRGQVFRDPEGVRLGRRNVFRIAWQARIPLLRSMTGFLKRDG